jgi:flagellar biosynthesis GTPase FlhF
MVDAVSGGLIGWACGKLGDTILNSLISDTRLVRDLDKAVAKWANSAPEYVHPNALFPEVDPETARVQRPEYCALQARLIQNKLPSKEQWHSVFVESWHWARKNVEDPQPFFSLSEAKASSELERLAQSTYDVCVRHEPVFKNAVVEGLNIIDGKVEGVDKKLDGVREYLEDILKVVSFDETRKARALKTTTDAEDDYKRILREELGTVRMLGSPDVPNVPVDLLDTFVSLDITATPAKQYRDGRERCQMTGEAERKLSPEATLKWAFRDHRMLLILGDPGSGKTTLVKYYAILCLKGKRYRELGFDKPPLVIYLPLREIDSKNGELCPLHECLEKWASRHYISISKDTFLG